MAMFESKTFQEILTDDAVALANTGATPCTASDVLLLSYSLNPEVLNEILIESGLVNRYKGDGELAEHVTCRIQSDRYQCGEGCDPDDLPFAAYVIETGRVKGIQNQGKSYHPKLIALLKDNDGEQRVQLIVSSRNLTKTSMLEGVLCLEGEVKTDDTVRNQELTDFLTGGGGIEPDNAVVQALGKSDFSKSIQRICDDKEAAVEFCPQRLKERLLDDLNGAKKVTVVSPFLGTWGFLDEFIKKCPDFQIITNWQIASDSVPEGKTEVPHYIKGFKNDQTKLHAKLYAVDREKDSVLYIGSANFSENGLKRNHELLCRIVSRSCRFADAVRNSFGELVDCEIANSPEEPEELEPAELPAFSLSAQEREALEEKMQEALGKAQLTEAFRCLFERPDADAPLDDAIRRLIEMNGSYPDDWKTRKDLFRLYASTCREDVKTLLRELCDGIE